MYMKKILLLLISILSLTGCGKSHDPYDVPEEVVLNTNTNEYEIYTEIDTKNFISDSNVKILNHSKIEAEKLGTNTYTFEFTYKDKNYKKDVTYSIIDVNPPIIVSAPSSKTIQVNDAYMPCTSVVFIDDVDKHPECFVTGEYDLTKIGTYNIKLNIKDASNNIKEHDLKLNIVEKLPPSNGNSSQPSKLNFSDVIAKHKNDSTMIGIDVSRWQGDIDFEAVKNAGCEFVIMRMGIMSDVDKYMSEDSYYDKNIKKAKEAGLKVGVYVYTSAINAKMAKSDAEWTVNYLKNEQLDFPIAYDWENWSKLMKYETTIHDMEEALATFDNILKKNGYDTMLYSSKFYLENVWQNKKNLPVWLANYTSKTYYQGDYIMWQMSSTGRIDGIKGDVDIDIYYMNKN